MFVASGDKNKHARRLWRQEQGMFVALGDKK